MIITIEVDKFNTVEIKILKNSLYDIELIINFYDPECYYEDANQIKIKFLNKKDLKKFINMIKKN